ncbi:thiazole synthase [Nitratireductor basaltis]|uniref:Thiazole synthase n=1 Tax=Nitratireductor basaltis TaxID=472175 RepID=A0A084UE76_9HYPH|nr:thiazole synthase [Nitratireductor basaltis]KFB11262.1 Thiazole synthase [Nitratireductor basaltis]
MLTIYGKTLSSRLFLGTAQYPSPAILADAARASNPAMLTVSLRREMAGGQTGSGFWDVVRELGIDLLPNTAGCHSAKEAITTAQMARELFGTDWIKLEVIGHHDMLQPDVFGLVEAARALSAEGFKVFPYTTTDIGVAERLLEAGCEVLMPWCAPIGSARGPQDVQALKSMRGYFPDVPLVVDAGLGRPSHAMTVLEHGYDAVLLNTAVAGADDPVGMARAFALAVDAGRLAFESGMLEPRDMAVPSTPTFGMAEFS